MKATRFPQYPENSRRTSLARAIWRHRLSTGNALVALCASALALSAGKAQAQRPLGVDVSSYQGGSINWTSVKGDGVSFAWAKATEGLSINDADYSGNISRGKAAGVYMGSYNFVHPEANTPASEQNHFWSISGGNTLADGLTLMPMLDFEVFSGAVGASSYSAWANDWCADEVADAAASGVKLKPAIYTSACHACNFNSSIAQWGSDVADYNGENVYTGTPWSTCTGCEVWGSGVWNFWQVSSTGSISGISGNVDLDGFNGTASSLVSTQIATAAVSAFYYWDPQGNTGGNPYTGSMTGTWENAKWSTASGGQLSPVNWVDGKAAVFGANTGIGTPAYTITMNSDHVVAGFFDGPRAPNSCDVTIAGSGTITLANGPQGLDAHNASDGSLAFIRINVPITGEGQLYPEDNGQSFLNASNSYTGGTTLGYHDASSTNAFNGILNFNNGNAFGTGTITLWKWGNNGALVASGTAAMTVPNNVTLANPVTNNFVGTTGGVTYSGNWTMGGNLLTFETGNTAGKIDIISGVMSGTAGLTISDVGTLKLTGVNTYSGTTTIVSPAVFSIAGAGQLGSGTYANNIVNGGTFNYSSSATQTFSGVISGAGPFNINGGGLLVLSGVNTYTGATTISGAATVCLNADSGLGTAAGAVTLNGGCLKNNNSSPTLGASRTITLGASGGYFDAGWSPSHPVTVNSKLTGSGKLMINLDGSPVVLANTGNNYTGNTIIGTNGPGYYSAGTFAWLKLGASGVIPNGAGNGNVFIYQAYGGLLDLAGFTQTINGLSGDGEVDNTAGNGSLTVGNNNATSTFNGVIQNSVGTLALTKIGAGTLTLGGANTYAGATTVSAGTLALGGGSVGNSPVTVASSATLANTTTNIGAIGGASTLSSGALATLTAVGGSSPIVGKFSAGGDLNLNNNALTINVTGAELPPGTYTLLDCAGNLTGAANPTPTFTGIPLGNGLVASINTTAGSAGHVDLVVQSLLATPSFSNLTANASVVYGSAGVTLSGTVSAPGPVYPTNGETITVTINGNGQSTAINDSTGDFSLSYNLAGFQVSGSPYTIAYSYAGDAALSAAADTSRTLTVSPLPVAVAGARVYDGSNDVVSAILAVTNALGSDVVTVAAGGGALASSNAGPETILSFGSLTLGGAAASNYTFAGASGLVSVSPYPVAVTGTRAYDGSNDVAAAILTVTNAIGSDTVTVTSGSGTLTSGNVGTNTISSFGTLALGGAASNNYTFAGASGFVTITTPPFSIIGNSVDVSGSNFIITWQSAPGASYHVISSIDPTQAMSNWLTVAGPIIATDTNTSVTNPINAPTSVFDVISP